MTNFKGIWAVVPVKDLGTAKQRLASALNQSQRTALYRCMLLGVLDALRDARALGGVLVVTRDPWAIDQARSRAAIVLEEPENQGHTAASTLGAAYLARHGARGMLQVPGDLPLLASADIDALLAQHGDAPAVTIAPSRDELGSNGLACSPADLLPLRFGDDSYFPHLARARELGVEPRIIRRDGFALDVDTPEDLTALLARPERTPTHAYLASIEYQAIGDGE
ncbi:MAG: 2-phospho-L-lactate guanylyltransferase [Gammaproteobacteria bacterium]|jgi:2-phospho-L-lactate guanylyltransferase